MSLTDIGWTATPLNDVLTLLRDARVDGETLLAAGTHAAGELLPGFTFNPWIGCEKVSRACKRCYAEAWSRRVGYTPDGHHHLRVWGPAATTPRVRTSADNWKRPLRWNRLAGELGVRLKVFSGSLCDIGEDHPLANEWRGEFFDLVEATENLDWLMLTKRPGHLADQWRRPWNKYGLKNAWVGATVEDQPSADARIRDLLRINAAVHFLSCEPLVGPVDLDPMWCDQCHRTEADLRADGEWSEGNGNGWCNACEHELSTGYCLDPCADHWQRGVSWVVTIERDPAHPGCGAQRLAGELVGLSLTAACIAINDGYAHLEIDPRTARPTRRERGLSDPGAWRVAPADAERLGWGAEADNEKLLPTWRAARIERRVQARLEAPALRLVPAPEVTRG